MSNTINTVTLSEELAQAKEITKKESKEIVDFVLNSIKNAVIEGTEVRLAGFGIFATADTAAREGRNPITGEALSIPASKRVSFKASSTFKTAVKATVA